MLKEVIPLLRDVAQHAETNRMSTAKLAVTFAPVLYPSKNEASLSLAQTSYAQDLIRTLIEDCDELLP